MELSPEQAAMPAASLIAVDVGNARMKLGWFHGAAEPLSATSGLAEPGLPEPTQTLHLADATPDFKLLTAWLASGGDARTSLESPSHEPSSLAWYIGSVNRPATNRLVDWLREHRPADAITPLAAADLPLAVELAQPDRVGIDRLLDAVAVNYLRTPGRPAVVVDAGTAITVDLVAENGAFRGGAILPGITMAARALHEFTDRLPQVEMTDLAAPPPALGTDTEAAMRSGLFWGAVGGIRELVSRMADPNAEVFLTGGGGPAVAELLGLSARYLPHLTLAGIALSAREA